MTIKAKDLLLLLKYIDDETELVMEPPDSDSLYELDFKTGEVELDEEGKLVLVLHIPSL